MITSFASRLRPLWRVLRSPSRHASQGFTLIELLVVIFIAGGIVSGLMYLAVELIRADEREFTRTETQRDLQIAMDYISSELKEAVYVYPDASALGNRVDFNLPADSMPVLAFWKQQRLPAPIRQRCSEPDPPNDVPCLSGHSYTLVVYSLTRSDVVEENENDLPPIPWEGRARIIRSALSLFDDASSRNTGYVSPVPNNTVDFSSWPPDGSTPEFSAPVVLTDFVDDGVGAAAAAQTRSGLCPGTISTPAAPDPDANYVISPSVPLDGTVRSFYACISQAGADAINPEAQSQEVVVYLQGNAQGRSGLYREAGFLPVLETRVLSRGILNKNPVEQ